MSQQNHYIYEFGPFRLDAQKRLLRREGEIVPLKPKAFETLLALVEESGRVLEKDELMRRVWPGTAVEEGNLTFNISTLRKALGDDPRRHEYIVTIPGEGYRFVADVRATFDELIVHESTSITFEEEEETSIAEDGMRNADSQEIAAPAARDALLLQKPPAASRQPQPYRLLVVAAALCVVGVAAASGIYWFNGQRRTGDGARVFVPFGEMDISRQTTSGKVTHAAISPDGKYIAHVTADAEGDSLWVRQVGAPSGVRLSGHAATVYVSVTFAPDGDSIYYVAVGRDKGDTALYRVPMLGGPSSKVADDVGPVAFSPDSRRITFLKFYQGGESRLIMADADGTNERTLAVRRHPESFRMVWHAPAWSPDGRTIACPVQLNDERGQYDTVVGVSVEDGAQRPLTSARWYSTGQPVWLADGAGLFVTASESASAPVQIWHVALQSGEASRITNDLNDYHDLSLTRDAGKLLAVHDHSVSSIWVAPEADASRAEQIASDAGRVEEMAWTPDGRLVYRSNAGGRADIWVMDADGSNPKQLTTGARVSGGLTVSPDGHHIFFASDRTGRFQIWRVDADGANLKQLTTGDDELFPFCTPDGEWVVFQRGVLEPRLWKVPVDGGEPVQLTETRAMRSAVSPDGKLIAYYYLDPELRRWGIGIVSSGGGRRIRRFDFLPTVAWRFIRWSPDGQSIAYPNTPGGVSDIWAQPLDGGAPKRLTEFKAEHIIAFDWSRDGRSLAFVRRVETSDVVLIEQHRK